MFYKKGIDITNDKQMFNFLKNHFTYVTMNYWNGCDSIANNVKLYNLELEGDWTVAYKLLDRSEYLDIQLLIEDWEYTHPEYTVYFNGRSNGYLVLAHRRHNYSILPDSITECDDYEEYKRYCRDYYGSVKANRDELVEFTQLVRDFDKLCDELRDYCNELSILDFATVEMSEAVEAFNTRYESDLEHLNYKYLECTDEGVVDLTEVLHLQALTEAFLSLANRDDYGYRLKFFDDVKIKLVEA